MELLKMVQMLNCAAKNPIITFPIMPQDIRNQRLYRQRRKQEMVRLRATLKNLAAKRAFFQEQVDYYNQYVKTCLDNLSTKGK